MSGDERQHNVWEHGREIAQALKNVQLEGLTGTIRYKEFSQIFEIWAFQNGNPAF